MNDNPPSQTTLREHASELRLHGLLAHWALATRAHFERT